MRPWAIWRRGIVLSVFGLLFFGAVLGIYFQFFYVAANCFDNQLNGSESGVDCGGGCVRICVAEVIPPEIIWARSFRISDSQYNAVAYVENKNQIAATKELDYTFELLNEGTVVARRSGTTVFPPNSVHPIFEGRIVLDNPVKVTDTRIIIEPAELWQPATVLRGQFKSSDTNLVEADARPKLYVDIENTELETATDVEVIATIFNGEGEAVTASRSVIEKIDSKTEEQIVFTWPNSIARTVRSCIVPTDVVLAIDLSGSMNNDGETPPEPVTSALAAAASFTERLGDNDQVAVVTFATDATTESELTTAHQSTAEQITALQIAPEEETGFTNTAAALTAARAELDSVRHNQNARKVLVLLTDGLPTAADDADAINQAVAAAQSLNTSDIEVYAIGLGSGVDADFIRSMVQEPENAYFAPSGDDLANIYSQITSAICEAGPTKIDIIAQTKTTFTPLR